MIKESLRATSDANADRLATLNEYLDIAMRDPDNNKEYIEDLNEAIAMLTPRVSRS